MASPVQSIPLKVVYFIIGGLPALVLAVLCAIFGVATFWAVLNTAGDEKISAILISAVFGAGVAGAVSGWLAFFGVGLRSKTACVTHTLFLLGGIGAAIFYAIQLAKIEGQPVLVVMFPLFPAAVGACLIFHIWSSFSKAIQGAAEIGVAER